MAAMVIGLHLPANIYFAISSESKSNETKKSIA
jgi:hypothetical protein